MQENVPVKYKCGHTVNTLITYKRGNEKEREAVINAQGKRFICIDCRLKELGG